MNKNKNLIVILIIIAIILLIFLLYKPKKPTSSSTFYNYQSQVQPSSKIITPKEETIIAVKSRDLYNRYIATDCKVVSGCNGPIECVDKDSTSMASICVALPEYSCYKASTARCEKQASNKCGWTNDKTLSSCIDKAQNPKKATLEKVIASSKFSKDMGIPIQECTVEGKTTFIIRYSYMDGGDMMYDSSGNLSAVCPSSFRPPNYQQTTPTPYICTQPQISCNNVYSRTTDTYNLK